MEFRIDNLRIVNVRGIHDLDLPVAGENLIIVGENGSGKSSLVDALEYYFTGHIEHLEGRSDVDKRQCFPSLNGGSSEVALTFKEHDAKTEFSVGFPAQKAMIPKVLEPIMSAARSRPFVLRRYQLLGFINARDSERYQQISQLIGLEDLDQIEIAWRKRQREIQKKVEGLDKEGRQIRKRLEEILGQSIGSEEALIRIANIRSNNLGLLQISCMEEFPKLQESLQCLCQSPEVALEVELRTLQEQTKRLGDDIGQALAVCHQLQQNIRLFWDQSAFLEDANLLHLLQEGYGILRENARYVNCPLCERPIEDYPALLQRLSSRLTGLESLVQHKRQITQCQNRLGDLLVGLETKLMALVKPFTKLGLGKYLTLLSSGITWVRSWRTVLSEVGHNGWIDQRLPDDRGLTVLQDAWPQIIDALTLQLEGTSSIPVESGPFNLLITFAKVFEQWQSLQVKEQTLQQTRHAQKQIDLIYAALVESRRRGLKELGEGLEEDFKHLYAQLHPDEGYDAITLQVQEDKRGSIGLRVVFHEQDAVHPLNYLSEGHLDSLGLCIFLAFIRYFSRDFKLIVLDDVLTTVDSGHRLRVARLLAREFSDYQFVITTHDRLWANELKTVFSRAKVYYLKPWCFETGTCCQQAPLSDWDYYHRQAEEGRFQDAIAGGGRNLERFLYQMRNNLGIAVPAKPDEDYTIGDLYGPFFKWLKDHSPIERPDWPQFGRDVQIMEEELNEVWRLRNWGGAHFNAWAAHVDRDEALSFLSAIENLVEAFSCPVCHGLVVYNRKAGILQCPYCQPKPFPSMTYQYQPTWSSRVAHLLSIPNDVVKQNVSPMMQSVLDRFLHDIRHRLCLPVQPNLLGDYEFSRVYESFFAWADSHPRPEISEWRESLVASKYVFDAYWENDQWLVVPESALDEFFASVNRLTQLFTCKQCSQLLNYDQEKGVYFCLQCSGQKVISVKIPAYWFVKGNK